MKSPARLFRRALLLALLAPLGCSLALAQTQMYVVREGQLPYAGRTQHSVNVVVDGPLNQTRDFFQDFMKDQYRLSFRGGLASLVNVGKLVGANNKTAGNAMVSTKQQAGTFISSRPVDLYAAFTTLADSTTEVALFGGFGDKTFFSPDLTTTEFKRLGTMMEKYAPAARYNAFRQQVVAAEAAVATIDKEKTRLDKDVQSAQSNTAANLKRIEELLQQNKANAARVSQDSLQLITNGQNRQTAQELLEKRRARLSATPAK